MEMNYLPTFHLPTQQWCIELWPAGSPPQTVEVPPERVPAGVGEALEPGVYSLAEGSSMGQVLAELKGRGNYHRRRWSGEPDWDALKPDDVSFKLCPDGVEFQIAGRAEAVPWWWRLDNLFVEYGVSYEACRPGCHPIMKGYKPEQVAGFLVELGFKRVEGEDDS